MLSPVADIYTEENRRQAPRTHSIMISKCHEIPFRKALLVASWWPHDNETLSVCTLKIRVTYNIKNECL